MLLAYKSFTEQRRQQQQKRRHRVCARGPEREPHRIEAHLTLCDKSVQSIFSLSPVVWPIFGCCSFDVRRTLVLRCRILRHSDNRENQSDVRNIHTDHTAHVGVFLA